MTEEKFNIYRKLCFKRENDRYIRTYFNIISHYKCKNANLPKENGRLPENFEKHYIIPREWFKESLSKDEYEKKEWKEKENIVYVPHGTYLRLLVNLYEYFKQIEDEEEACMHFHIKEKIRRLFKIYGKTGDTKTDYENNLTYLKAMNSVTLKEEDYIRFENTMKGHYKGKYGK